MKQLIKKPAQHYLFIFLGLQLLLGCSNDISDYPNNKPQLILEQFFNGHLTASGIVEDYSGKVIRTFNVTMKASWQGNQGIIDEDFVFNDGETQNRIWNITKLNNNTYEGIAGDIIGVASGQAKGHALRWQYDMVLALDGENYQVHFDDWMFLVNDNTIINRSDIQKLGINVGRVILVIQKQAI